MYSRLASFAIALSLAPVLPAQKPEQCLKQRHYGRTAEARSCFEGLARSHDAYLRAEGLWGLERFNEANDSFRAAVKASPDNAHYRVRWGQLYLERVQPADAIQLFTEALKLEPDNPRALLGIAEAAASNFNRSALELAQKALAVDPKLYQAHELLARVALEEGDQAKAREEADKALAISPEALDAMAVRATIDWMNDQPSMEWMERILKVNPIYGEAYALAAHLFVINRRYEEGIAFYRKAIELNPRLWPARSQLGVNLMRLGREKEARQQLEMCYENGYKDSATVNTLRLMDSYKHFKTFTGGNISIRLHNREADLLFPYFEAELRRAIATYDRKYKMKLDHPVQVEVYPDHEDFAVRTMGMPGLGALGVTFGYVIAMDSPSGRKPGTFHWASTLWHELSHVYVLAATKHRAPRWFTEGMAVHEETATSPDWGDRLDPDIIDAIRKERLLPVAELDRGFIRPNYPNQVIVSYFQAGRICDFINEKWGYDKLLGMMHAFTGSKTTPRVIEEQLGVKASEFDRQFLEWLHAQVKKTLDGFDDWRKQMKELAANAKKNDHDEVIRQGRAIRDIYPDYVEAGSVYQFLADAYLAKNDKTSAMGELETYARTGGRDPDLLKKLAALQEQAGRKKDAAETLNRLNYIYPVNDEELHQRLGGLYLETGNLDGAIREYRAVVAMKPQDAAGSHYNLARAYRAANKMPEAREHV
ncbi:MAG: tetratricopeptide repeat protein, partial [Bryobacteraceae bacterium]|nr:tetratricopeptide repeat protein [Bryobacteraceae bacterium]